jgi:hypothetical protein
MGLGMRKVYQIRYVCATRRFISANTRINTAQIWRRRVGVEPTIRPAKDRIASFEGRESHRTKCASADSIADERMRTCAGPGRNEKSRLIVRFGISDANRCGLVATNKRGYKIMQRLAGAHFIIGMRRSRADFTIRQ